MLKVTAMGYLGKDAELKTYRDSTFLSFNLGVNPGKNKPAVWISCSSNNTNLVQWLKKGSRVLVIGTAVFKPYMDKSGVFQPGMNLYCDSIEFVPGTRPNNDNGNVSHEVSVSDSYSVSSIAEDDMPF
jgi:single-stranded DNA-binding protein